VLCRAAARANHPGRSKSLPPPQAWACVCAPVAVRGTVAVADFLVRDFFDRLPLVGANVRDGDKLHVRLIEHFSKHQSAAPSNSDAAEDDSFAGRDESVSSQSPAGNDCRDGEQGARGDTRFQELPP
jgi:hypothetical protein